MKQKCYWCGGETSNITIDEKGNISEIRPCYTCDSPENIRKGKFVRQMERILKENKQDNR